MAIQLILLSLFATSLAQNSSNTIIDILKAKRETTLLDLIQTAGLTDTLKTGGPFTLFAPSSYALSKLDSATVSSLKANTDALGNLLKYHLVSGTYMKQDLMVNEKMLTSVAGPMLRLNYYLNNHHLAVQGARVFSSAYKADNGVVYTIDNVISPPNGTIYDLGATDPDFSTLKAAVDAAGLASLLQDGPLTVFAPNNAAFQRLGDDLIQKLLANKDLLKSILAYHVLHGTLYSTGMHTGSLSNLEQVDQERLYASFTGRTVHIDSANVIDKDVSATNGVAHVIDHVLIPSSLVAQIKAL